MLVNEIEYVGVPDFWEIKGYRNYTIRSSEDFLQLAKNLKKFAKYAKENGLRVCNVAFDHFPEDDDPSPWVWSAVITVEP